MGPLNPGSRERDPELASRNPQQEMSGLSRKRKEANAQRSQEPAAASPPGRLDRQSRLRLCQAGRLVQRHYLLRDARSPLSAGWGLLVGVRREVEEDQT